MKMEPFRYTKTARPTLYNGTNYRSDLEASWAAFFDIRGITAEYEPALDLVSWRPDFLIRVDTTFELAEVKPFISEEQWRGSRDILCKITESLHGSTLAILLGGSPLVPANFLFRILPNSEGHEFESLTFGPTEDVLRDWKRAKNIVQWRPSGS